MCEAGAACQRQAVPGTGCLTRVIAPQHLHEEAWHVTSAALTKRNTVRCYLCRCTAVKMKTEGGSRSGVALYRRMNESVPVSCKPVRFGKEYSVERYAQNSSEMDFWKSAVLHQERDISVLLGPNITK